RKGRPAGWGEKRTSGRGGGAGRTAGDHTLGGDIVRGKNAVGPRAPVSCRGEKGGAPQARDREKRGGGRGGRGGGGGGQQRAVSGRVGGGGGGNVSGSLQGCSGAYRPGSREFSRGPRRMTPSPWTNSTSQRSPLCRRGRGMARESGL